MSSGRCGDYNPPAEGTSVRLKHRVKQARRVRALLGGIRKAEVSVLFDCQMQCLLQQWTAVQRAAGHGKCFQEWVLGLDFVGYFPLDFPAAGWLSDLVQLLEFD